jgi:hypothetical protein
MALRRNKKLVHPVWRPDFRDGEALPDIKVIRTDFLFNVVAVSLAIALLGFFLFREYRSFELAGTIRDLEVNIENNRVVDRENVRMSREFAEHERSIKEVIQFFNVPVHPETLFLELASMQPDAIILETVNVTSSREGAGNNARVLYTLLLSGTVEDSTAQPASQVITEYLGALEGLPSIKPHFVVSALPTFNRNPALGLFNFTVRVTLSETPVAPSS